MKIELLSKEYKGGHSTERRLISFSAYLKTPRKIVKACGNVFLGIDGKAKCETNERRVSRCIF